MKYIKLSFPTPQQNLACDEALLDLCEENQAGEILRFWESSQYFVVLGYSNKLQSEVHINSCRSEGIPVLRRSSGGGTVLQGPGCFNYSLILTLSGNPALKNLRSSTRYIMDKHREAFEKMLGGKISVEGDSDLALGGLKFSGNAQRRKKYCMLFHGTFLVEMDLPLIEKYLKLPPRQPVYRKNRTHQAFLMNIKLSREQITGALKTCWEAESPLETIPHDRIETLVREKYHSDDWNLKY